MRGTVTICWPAALLLLASCGDGAAAAGDDASSPGPDAAPLTISFAARQDDGGYAPITAGEPAELFVGIQGLRFLQLQLVARGGTDPHVDSMLTYTVDGLEPFTQTNIAVALTADPAAPAVRRSQPLNLVFAGSIGTDALRGHTAHLTGAFTGARDTAAATADLTIVDNDPCIHRPSPEEPLCPDAGM